MKAFQAALEGLVVASRVHFWPIDLPSATRPSRWEALIEDGKMPWFGLRQPYIACSLTRQAATRRRKNEYDSCDYNAPAAWENLSLANGLIGCCFDCVSKSDPPGEKNNFVFAARTRDGKWTIVKNLHLEFGAADAGVQPDDGLFIDQWSDYYLPPDPLHPCGG